MLFRSLAAPASTHQNPDWGIETVALLPEDRYIFLLQPTRIPTGGLKHCMSRSWSRSFSTSTHQNPDWGIETSDQDGVYALEWTFNPPESRLGD